jgi:hypothetical protein
VTSESRALFGMVGGLGLFDQNCIGKPIKSTSVKGFLPVDQVEHK